MRSLENRTRANLRCHFGGLAIAIPEPRTAAASKATSPTNTKAAEFDVETARKSSYKRMAEVAYNRYGTKMMGQSSIQQLAVTANKVPDALAIARQKIFDALKASPEIAEVSDLYADNRYRSIGTFDAFAPIFFVYRPPAGDQPQEAEKKTTARRFYFVYNGRYFVLAAFSEPGTEIPALPETVSQVCLLLSRSGYEFHRLTPIPTLQSLDLGGTSAASSPIAGVLNDSIGRLGTTTSLLVRMPKSVQDSLRSLYAISFQYLMAFYSLKEESDTQEALFQTIEAHREAVLDLMHEFNQTRGRQFLRRRKLRKLIRAHCLNLTEKIGRADATSDSLAQGITSLEANLQHERDLRVMLEGEPNWKSYLSHDFDTGPVLDMITRAGEEISRPDIGYTVFWVALLAAAAGAIVGSFIGRIL